MEHKGERTHGHGQQCVDCWGERGVRRINDNGKNTKKKEKKDSVVLERTDISINGTK